MAVRNTLQLAREGNVEAIATLLNRSLNSQGITATIRLKNHCLEIMLEAERSLAPEALMKRLHKGMTDLQVPSIQAIHVYAKQTHESFPDWQEEVSLKMAPPATAETLGSDLPVPTPSRYRAPSTPASSALSLKKTAVSRRPSFSKGSQQGFQKKSSGFVLFKLPSKSVKLLIFASVIVALQIGGALGLLIWNKLNQKPVLSQASPQLTDSNSVGLPVMLPKKSVYVALIKYKHRGIPVIDVTFNGTQNFEMIVDTGASGTLVTQDMANILQIMPARTATLSIADGSVVELPVGYVRSISVDGAMINNVPVVIAPGMSIGLLGHDFFDGFDIKIKQDVVEFYPR